MVGATISSTVLEPQLVNGTEFDVTDEMLRLCGANDCPGNNVSNPNLEEPDPTLVNKHCLKKRGRKSLCDVYVCVFVKKLFR